MIVMPHTIASRMGDRFSLVWLLCPEGEWSLFMAFGSENGEIHVTAIRKRTPHEPDEVPFSIDNRQETAMSSKSNIRPDKSFAVTSTRPEG